MGVFSDKVRRARYDVPTFEEAEKQETPFDYSLTGEGTPTAENSYGGGGQLPTPTSVATSRKINKKVQDEQKRTIANYNALSGTNGLDYTTGYLSQDDNTLTPEERSASPVFNKENDVVNNFADYAERKKALSNADYLKEEGLVDAPNDMDGDKMYEEYMKGAPEYVSEEEQQRRLRASRSAKTVADLGSIASAFANLYYTNRPTGGINQQVAYAKAPDYQTYINQWQKQRDAYRTYAQKGVDYVYQKQKKAIDDEYNRALQQANIELKNAELQLKNETSTAKQQALALAAQKARDAAELAKKKYEKDTALVDARIKKINNDIANNNARTQAYVYGQHHKGSKGGGSGSGSTKVFKGGNTDYDIPSSTDQTRMMDAIAKDFIENGIIDPNVYETKPDGEPITLKNGKKIVKRAKTKEEINKEVMKNWDNSKGHAEDIVTRDYRGTRRGESVTASKSSSAVYKTKDGSKSTNPAAYTAEEKAEKEASKSDLVTTSDGKTRKKFEFKIKNK